MKKIIYLLTLILIFIPLVVSANFIPENAYSAIISFTLFITLTATLINALVETAVGLIYILITKKDLRILLYQFIANTITYIPFFYLIAIKYNFTRNYPVIIAAETIIFIIEALIIKYLSRPNLSTKEALTLSFISNVVSIVAGIIITA